ncbi:hypothetical protein FNH22_17880 [Fulvivirga sp. M361]|uniref:hypothetical protein n=1 Tax=Fulvivirga sp. M361 TaxID=2594266 RepID=UPI00117A4BD8|nr:hypothetical protein [Fulvivirga sp. M361]TRX56031.1 hypothetical protein FNH22_17880 [Fulvivirga sp. M361]
MKLIINTKYILAFMLLALWACDSEDKYVNPADEYPKGGLVRADIREESQSINLFGDLNAQTITFDLTPFDDSGTRGEFIEKLDIFGVYSSPLGGFNSDTVLISTETTLVDATVSYTLQQMVDTYNELTTLGDINGGDNFIFVFQTTMKDGRVFHPNNIAPAICGAPNARGTCTFSIPVVCPSDIPEGTYAGTSVGFSRTTTKDVTIAKSGDLIYDISDLSAGMLGSLTNNPAFEGGGQIQDLCNLINVPTFSPPGLIPVSQVAGDFGSYNPTTGIIVIKWSIAGSNVTTTLVPK